MKRYIKYIQLKLLFLQSDYIFLFEKILCLSTFICCDAFFIMGGCVYSVFCFWLSVSQPSSQLFSNSIKTHNCRIKRWKNRETQRHAQLHTWDYPKANPPTWQRCFSASWKDEFMSSESCCPIYWSGLPSLVVVAYGKVTPSRWAMHAQPAHPYAVALRKWNQSTCGQ